MTQSDVVNLTREDTILFCGLVREPTASRVVRLQTSIYLSIYLSNYLSIYLANSINLPPVICLSMLDRHIIAFSSSIFINIL